MAGESSQHPHTTPLDPTETERPGAPRPSADFSLTPEIKPHCPHCHHTLPLFKDADNEILCPACGSSFRLEACVPATTVDQVRQLDKFQLLRRVGHGSFGTVWQARDPELDRIVALKVPHASLVAERSYLDRFQREARAAAQLRHPGIVRLYEVRTIDNVPVIVSDFIDGIPLGEWLQIRRPTFRETARIVAEIADALDYAHNMGLVHRDIKPSNIMMERVESGEWRLRTARQETLGATVRDKPKTATRESTNPQSAIRNPQLKPVIVDFGLALRAEAEVVMTVEGQLLGTIAYMSPEQAAGQGHRATNRADIYCLGVVLYEMLTGEMPFRGSKTMLIHQVLNEEPRRLRQINDKIARDLETICLKALNKEPAKRYPTAKAMADDLRNYLENRPIQARPAGRVERFARWCKRNPKLAGMSGLAALAGIGAVIAIVVALLIQSAKLRESKQNLARSTLKDALQDLEAGKGNLGLLMLCRSLEQAPADDEDLQRVIRTNLSAWMARAPVPKGIVQHENEVVSMAVSPDGKLAATGTYKKAFLWEVETGKIRAELPHDYHAWAGIFSPKGDLLITAGGDQRGGEGSIRFWDAETGQQQGSPILVPKIVRSIYISADGRRLLAVSDENVARVFDVHERKLLGASPPHEGLVRTGAISPDGRLALTGGDDRRVRLWEAATGKQLWSWTESSGATVLVFSPDGKRFASGHNDGGIDVRSLEASQSPGVTAAHQNVIHDLRFSKDGRRLLSASADGTARVWDSLKGQPLMPPLRQAGPINSIATNSSERYIVTGSNDNTVRIWEAATGRQVGLPLQHQGNVKTVGFGYRDIVLSSSDDYSARSWALPVDPPWASRFPVKGNVLGAAVTPDNKRILTVSGAQQVNYQAQFWDVTTGAPSNPSLDIGPKVWRVAISPDCRLLASARLEGPAQVWDLSAGQKLRIVPAHKDNIRAMAFDLSSRLLVTSSTGNEVILWSIDSEKSVARLELSDIPISLALSSDGAKVLAGCKGRQAAVWDLTTTSPTLLKAFSQEQDVQVVAFSPARDVMATASDKNVRLWSARDPYEHCFLLSHPARVDGLAFSPNGLLVATACADGFVRLWDVVTGKQLGPPLGSPWPSTVRWIVGFASKEPALFVTGPSQAVYFWRLPEPVSGDLADIRHRIEALTMMELDQAGAPRQLDQASWQARLASR